MAMTRPPADRLQRRLTINMGSPAQVHASNRSGDTGAIGSRLGDGRLHLHHGPIDLIIEASGHAAAVRAAYSAAGRRFSGMLSELVQELAALRTPIQDNPVVAGTTAMRMCRAAGQFRPNFITPMAAVAGAVADEILASMRTVPGLRRIYVNNGGDISLWLAGNEAFRLGVIPDIGGRLSSDLPATVRLTAASGVGGIATSGWRGRSQSLGIADSVTVFAIDATMADAAATLIANAVNIDSPNVAREPAVARSPDSDLGQRPVTIGVDPLSDRECLCALRAGAAVGTAMCSDARIIAAILFLQGEVMSVGDIPGGSRDSLTSLQTAAVSTWDRLGAIEYARYRN